MRGVNQPDVLPGDSGEDVTRMIVHGSRLEMAVESADSGTAADGVESTHCRRPQREDRWDGGDAPLPFVQMDLPLIVKHPG